MSFGNEGDAEESSSWTRQSLERETSRLIDLLDHGVGDGDALSLTDMSEVNRVLQGWAQIASNEKDGIQAAQRSYELLMMLEDNVDRLALDGKTSNNNNKRYALAPDDSSYNFVLHAFAVCKGGGVEAAEQAEELLTGMRSRSLDFGSMPFATPAPTTKSFNIVANAWAKSGHADAGRRAEQLYSKMEEWWHDSQQKELGDGGGFETETGASAADAACPNVRTLSAVMDAWAQTGMKEATDRVMAILDVAIQRRHEQQQTRPEGGIVIQPNTILFNSAILSWVNSGKGQLGAEKAQEILEKMESLHQSGELANPDLNADEDDIGLAPTTQSYSLVMNAWAKSEDDDRTGYCAQRAKEVLEKMVDLYKQGFNVKPNTICFTTVITSLARSRGGGGGVDGNIEEAESLLDTMLALYDESGDDEIKPNAVTGNALIAAWAKSGRADASERAERVLHRMHRYAEPDIYSYNTVLDAYASQGDVRAATKLLHEMEKVVNPDVVSYNTVLKALSKAKGPKSAENAERMLLQMEQRNVKPDAVSYTCVITAWSKSSNHDKSIKASDLLEQMIAAYREQGDKSMKPDAVTFTSLISACASTRGDGRQRKSALRLAIKTFERMQNTPDFDNPNHLTYTALFRACARLASDNKERFRLLQGVFQQCRQDGHLNKYSLDILSRGIPASVLNKVIPDAASIPEAWYAHVRKADRPARRINDQRVSRRTQPTI